LRLAGRLRLPLLFVGLFVYWDFAQQLPF